MGLFGKRSPTKGAGAPSLLGVGSQFVGNLHSTGPLLVNGTVKGDGTINGELTIAPGAQWYGDVQARTATIAGTIVGNLEVAGALKISASAVIHGNVTARGASIAPGAVVDGEVRVTNGKGAAASSAAI